MKFLNKKEQVFDIQLTSYGKHKLSAGDFKPTYYAFFDDNIVYDLEYTGGSEEQNNIHKRIKQDTQYLEGQTIFKQLMSGSGRYFTRYDLSARRKPFHFGRLHR